MSARDVIAKWLCCLEWLSPNFDDGDGDGPNWHAFRTYADDFLSALTSSGYRILGPDEIDAVTVEKCAAECEKLHILPNGDGVTLPGGRGYATAIRALCATHQGDK